MDHDRPAIPYIYLPPVPGITLTSNDVHDGANVPEPHHADVMGMTGDNLSPHLAWSGAPAETQSYAVSCFDPDAPTGSGFWHWMLFDIPADVTQLPRGAGSGDRVGLPDGALHVRNDVGDLGYFGIAPPEGDGEHRYVFAVHAVSVPKLGVDSSASPAFVGFNLTFNTLARGVIIAKYER